MSKFIQNVEGYIYIYIIFTILISCAEESTLVTTEKFEAETIGTIYPPPSTQPSSQPNQQKDDVLALETNNQSTEVQTFIIGSSTSDHKITTSKSIDMLWVVDNSGSMKDDISHVQTALSNFTKTLKQQQQKLDIRVVIISGFGSSPEPVDSTSNTKKHCSDPTSPDTHIYNFSKELFKKSDDTYLVNLHSTQIGDDVNATFSCYVESYEQLSLISAYLNPQPWTLTFSTDENDNLVIVGKYYHPSEGVMEVDPSQGLSSYPAYSYFLLPNFKAYVKLNHYGAKRYARDSLPSPLREDFFNPHNFNLKVMVVITDEGEAIGKKLPYDPSLKKRHPNRKFPFYSPANNTSVNMQTYAVTNQGSHSLAPNIEDAFLRSLPPIKHNNDFEVADYYERYRRYFDNYRFYGFVNKAQSWIYTRLADKLGGRIVDIKPSDKPDDKAAWWDELFENMSTQITSEQLEVSYRTFTLNHQPIMSRGMDITLNTDSADPEKIRYLRFGDHYHISGKTIRINSGVDLQEGAQLTVTYYRPK